MKMRKARHRNWRSNKTWTFAPWYRVTTIAPDAATAWMHALLVGEGYYRGEVGKLIAGEIGTVDSGFRIITSTGKEYHV